MPGRFVVVAAAVIAAMSAVDGQCAEKPQVRPVHIEEASRKPAERTSDLPEILLIGDSIRIGPGAEGLFSAHGMRGFRDAGRHAPQV